MICNFIKFVIPNPLEAANDIYISKKIYSELKVLNLQQHFYIWLGYDKLFYNMIYQYEQYEKDELLIKGPIMLKLNLLKSNTINPFNIIDTLKIKFPSSKRVINNFIDITSNENFINIDNIPPTSQIL